MTAEIRRNALKLLYSVRPNDFAFCREVESHCRAIALSDVEYSDHITRAAFNLKENPLLGIEVVYKSDRTLAVGTIVGRIETERVARTARFERMLQEKYEELDDEKFQAIVRCRRCGSEDVSWEEKQTRSSDEGATVFCVCTTCKNRWVMR